MAMPSSRQLTLDRLGDAQAYLDDASEQLVRAADHLAALTDELDWWRKVFSTRFMTGNLPRAGSPLYGHRFTLVYADRDGAVRPWVNR